MVATGGLVCRCQPWKAAPLYSTPMAIRLSASELAVSLAVAFGVSEDNGLCLSCYGISRWVGGAFNVRGIMPDMAIIAIEIG